MDQQVYFSGELNCYFQVGVSNLSIKMRFNSL
jgi:hypothetical protein